ncbi:hypothetical protein [Peribacillus kribbensis]|uniref:hypothetical protein n=1 Tax=Peribacillus kribbensis TaxID=356658 RepID=UPI00041B3799|nr:hypothetical protein [Peribacillus kribbensis]
MKSNENDRTTAKVNRMDCRLPASPSGSDITRVVKDIFEIDLDRISSEYHGSVVLKYPEEIMEGILKEIGTGSNKTEIDQKIMAMKKAEAMDLFLRSRQNKLTGPEIRKVINDIFGINLDGISSLENGRISLYSKGQWILRNDNDLFVVWTGKNDKDAKIYPTAAFTTETGSNTIPQSLKEKLFDLGYQYKEDGSCYYEDPNDETVPDAFKGKTMGILLDTIKSL